MLMDITNLQVYNVEKGPYWKKKGKYEYLIWIGAMSVRRNESDQLISSFLFSRYGFITFENQEDAERIIKKEVSVDVSVPILFFYLYFINFFL